MINVLIYIGHPAQFHFFKNIITELVKDGNNVQILLKTKDILEQLVRDSGFDYINIQKKIRKNNVVSIALASFRRTFSVYRIAQKFNPDIIIGTDSSVAQSAKLLSIPGITVTEDDEEVVKRLAEVTYPFSDSIVVPSECSVGKWQSKKIGYYGYMKLAYLHPNRFIPDQNIASKYVKEDKYCIIRLAKLAAFHDVGINGLDESSVLKIISIADRHGYKVYISSEMELDDSLKRYELNIPYTDIHHILYFASLLVSDSQSMSMEAAMLGTPSLRFSDFSGRISVLEELEYNYGLTFGIKTDNKQLLYDKVEEFLSIPDLRNEFQERRRKMLADKIDVTAFFTWFIENYPGSKKVMQDNPDYQYRFK